MPDESWIAVDRAVDVVGRNGKTVVGRLEAGATVRTIGSNEHWYMIRLSDGSTGFVARTRARSVTGPPPIPPPIPEPVAVATPSPGPPPSPAAPPGQPPTQPPAAPPSGGGGNRRSWIIAAVVAVVVIAVVAAGAYFFLRDDTVVVAAGEVFLEPANDPGPDVFTTTLVVPDAPEIVNVAPVVATVTTAATTSTAVTTTSTSASGSATASGTKGPSGGGTALPAVSGSEPGLYGGTQDASRCDPDQMVAFLNSDPDKAQAWVLGINADPAFRWSGGSDLSVSEIPAFVAELTPVTLVADTRVTNNGYRDGAPTPRQAVLQAGTSVLVDPFGVPRTKCNCGNPLAPPVAQSTSVAYTGNTWNDFRPETTVVVQPAPAPMPNIKLVDVFTGELIERPIGTAGASDVPTGVIVSEPLVSSTAATTSTSLVAAPTTSTATTATTTTTTTPTTTTDPTTTTTAAPSVLTSGDFCTAFTEYSQIDEQYYDQYEDPESLPEYRAFVLAALTDLATIAPAPTRADWEWYRDAYRRDPGQFSGDITPEVEERFLRMIQYLETDCGLGVFGD